MGALMVTAPRCSAGGATAGGNGLWHCRAGRLRPLVRLGGHR